MPKDAIEAYAYWTLASITNEDGRKIIAIMEKGFPPDALLRGKQRARELQKEIDVKAKKLADETTASESAIRLK